MAMLGVIVLEAVHWTDVMTAITAGAAFVLLLLGSVIALIQIQQADKDRHVTILTDLSRRWDDPIMAGSRKAAGSFEGRPRELRDALLRASQQNSDEYWTLIRIPNFFEDLGVLVDEGVIPIRLVDKTLGGPVLYAWELFSVYAEWEQRSDPECFLYFARMAAELRARAAT